MTMNIRISLIILVKSLLITMMPYAHAATICGADATTEWIYKLKGKRVALVVNQTSRIGNALLPDTLKKRNINIVAIFSPEHGFRGNNDAGAKVSNSIDSLTGIPIFSLYGSAKKPNPKQLANTDVVIYDIQDVGVRFYTYISTLHYIMEACAECNLPLLILDRPNPQGPAISYNFV